MYIIEWFWCDYYYQTFACECFKDALMTAKQIASDDLVLSVYIVDESGTTCIKIK